VLHDAQYATWNKSKGGTVARIVFMGTPEFAVPALLALTESHQVVGVVTQPDRPAGRGRKVVAPPVKEAALARGLPIIQPETLRMAEAMRRLVSWRPDLIVVAAFGQILRTPVLALPPHGCLNVHASLLPRYRGAAPIPAAILAGDLVTGVTLMHMDEGLDTGPILARAECPITPDDTAAALTGKLAHLGAELLIEALPGWLSGKIQTQDQDDAQATYCRALKKEDGLLDWTCSALHLDRQVRACDPWPGAYTTWQGQLLKVLRARPRTAWTGEGRPGQVVSLEAGIGVVSGEGVLELSEVQLAGRKPLAADLFTRGQRGMIGGYLGEVIA
jgi:methionyl-tRNA formyltransferase